MQQPKVEIDTPKEKLIIITGFGTFEGHEAVNASWEAVKLLPDVLCYGDQKYVLEVEQVPVEYAAVDETVRNIWRRQPELVIHCGVQGNSDRLRIEKLAYNNHFTRPDVGGNYLENGTAHLEKHESNGKTNKVRFCELDLDQIVASISSHCGKDSLACVSKNVGSYLCGYIYIKSLDVDAKRCVFVHVPRVEIVTSYTASRLIYKIAEECVRQLNNCECLNDQIINKTL